MTVAWLTPAYIRTTLNIVKHSILTFWGRGGGGVRVGKIGWSGEDGVLSERQSSVLLCGKSVVLGRNSIVGRNLMWR